MNKKLLIIGAGGHGKVIADIAVKMNKWNNISFLDDNKNMTKVMGIDVLDNTKKFIYYIDDYEIFVAIGNNTKRKYMLAELEKRGATIPIIIHPSAIIGTEVEVELGTAIMAGVVINSCVRIGKGCIINTGATIDHDSRIIDYVHVSPGVNIAGEVTVGSESWLGAGSVIINNISIIRKSVIGAGAVVTKDILESGTYVGVPARKSN